MFFLQADRGRFLLDQGNQDHVTHVPDGLREGLITFPGVLGFLVLKQEIPYHETRGPPGKELKEIGISFPFPWPPLWYCGEGFGIDGDKEDRRVRSPPGHPQIPGVVDQEALQLEGDGRKNRESQPDEERDNEENGTPPAPEDPAQFLPSQQKPGKGVLENLREWFHRFSPLQRNNPGGSGVRPTATWR